MTIGFRGAATATSGSSTTTSLTISTSSVAVTDGDLLFMQVVGTGAGSTLTPPSGWTLQGHVTDNSTPLHDRTYLYTKIASSEPTSYTWTQSSGEWLTLNFAAYSGVNNTTPFIVAPSNIAGGSASNLWTSPSATATAAGQWAVYGVSSVGSSQTGTPNLSASRGVVTAGSSTNNVTSVITDSGGGVDASAHSADFTSTNIQQWFTAWTAILNPA